VRLERTTSKQEGPGQKERSGTWNDHRPLRFGGTSEEVTWDFLQAWCQTQAVFAIELDDGNGSGAVQGDSSKHRHLSRVAQRTTGSEEVREEIYTGVNWPEFS